MSLDHRQKTFFANFARCGFSIFLLVLAIRLVGCSSSNNNPSNPNPPAPTNTPLPSATPTVTGTPTLTATTTATFTITNTPTITATSSPTGTPTDSPTVTVTPTNTPIHHLITSWGSYAVPGGSGKFEGPVGVAFDGGYAYLYVADSTGYDLQKFRTDGSSGSDVVNISSSYQSEPEGVAADAFGNIYVANYYHSTMDVYNSSGVTTNVVQTWTGGSGSFNSILAVAISSGGLAATVACSNYGFGEIDFFHRNGTFISAITGYYARGLAYDSSGNLWVSEWNGAPTHNLYRFAPGATTPNLTLTALNSITFNSNEGVCTDTNGNVYLADTGNSRVVEMDGTGSYLYTFTGLSSPFGVATDSSNNVYISDLGTYKIYQYAP